MSTNKKITPMKGAGTLFYRLKNEKKATVVAGGVLQVNEVKKDANWDRIAKIKELQPAKSQRKVMKITT